MGRENVGRAKEDSGVIVPGWREWGPGKRRRCPNRRRSSPRLRSRPRSRRCPARVGQSFPGPYMSQALHGTGSKRHGGTEMESKVSVRNAREQECAALSRRSYAYRYLASDLHQTYAMICRTHKAKYCGQEAKHSRSITEALRHPDPHAKYSEQHRRQVESWPHFLTSK